jgi:hypothetical protein
MTPVSQGFRGGGPQDPVADAAHGGGDLAPEPDFTTGVVAAGTSLTMTEPATEVSPLWTQPGVATLKIVLEVDTTTSTGAATTGDGDDDELEVVTVHSGLRAPEHVSLSEAMSMSHFTRHQAQDVLQREWVDVEEERRHLSEWGSLLKECTISEREKAATK